MFSGYLNIPTITPIASGSTEDTEFAKPNKSPFAASKVTDGFLFNIFVSIVSVAYGQKIRDIKLDSLWRDNIMCITF